MPLIVGHWAVPRAWAAVKASARLARESRWRRCGRSSAWRQQPATPPALPAQSPYAARRRTTRPSANTRCHEKPCAGAPRVAHCAVSVVVMRSTQGKAQRRAGACSCRRGSARGQWPGSRPYLWLRVCEGSASCARECTGGIRGALARGRAEERREAHKGAPRARC